MAQREPTALNGSSGQASVLGKQLGTRWFGTSGPGSPKGHSLVTEVTPLTHVEREVVG